MNCNINNRIEQITLNLTSLSVDQVLTYIAVNAYHSNNVNSTYFTNIDSSCSIYYHKIIKDNALVTRISVLPRDIPAYDFIPNAELKYAWCGILSQAADYNIPPKEFIEKILTVQKLNNKFILKKFNE